jgi:hypothetical protein
MPDVELQTHRRNALAGCVDGCSRVSLCDLGKRSTEAPPDDVLRKRSPNLQKPGSSTVVADTYWPTDLGMPVWSTRLTRESSSAGSSAVLTRRMLQSCPRLAVSAESSCTCLGQRRSVTRRTCATCRHHHHRPQRGTRTSHPRSPPDSESPGRARSAGGGREGHRSGAVDAPRASVGGARFARMAHQAHPGQDVGENGWTDDRGRVMARRRRVGVDGARVRVLRLRAPAVGDVHLRHDRQAEGHPAHHGAATGSGASYTHWASWTSRPTPTWTGAPPTSAGSSGTPTSSTGRWRTRPPR